MALFKKNKEPYVEKTGLMGNAVDYNVYHMTIADRITAFIVGFFAGAAVIYIFYELIWVALAVGLVCGIVFIPIRRNMIINKRKKKLTMQFRELLEALSTSIGAGKNVFDSFSAAENDLTVQFNSEADIVKEVQIVIQGINNNLRVEDLLLDFADRSGLDDIKNFADVFATCYLKGGNIKEVIKNTTQIINDKIDIQMDIQAKVAGQKNEQNIMLVMPAVFVQLLKSMGGSLIDLTSPTGRISVTAALIIFVLAYFVSRKILDIKL